MKFKPFILVLFAILNLITFQLISKHLAAIAQENPPFNKEQVDCYDIQMLPDSKPTKEELQNRLNNLEKQYQEKKIDEKAYKTVKGYILKEMQEAQ